MVAPNSLLCLLFVKFKLSFLQFIPILLYLHYNQSCVRELEKEFFQKASFVLKVVMHYCSSTALLHAAQPVHCTGDCLHYKCLRE